MMDDFEYDDWAGRREEIEMLMKKIITDAMENKEWKQRKLTDEMKFFNSFSYDYIAEWAESSPLVTDFFIAEHYQQYKEFKQLLTDMMMHDV